MAEIQEKFARPTGGLSVQLIGAVRESTATDLSGGTDGNVTCLQTDASGNLRVTGGGGGSGGQVNGTGTTGAAIDTHPVLVGVSDGTNLQPVSGDTSGRVKVIGAAAVGAAIAGNPVLSGVSDGTNVQAALGDTSGRVKVVGAAANAAAVTGNPVLVAGTNGTNALSLATDASGNLKVQPLGPGATSQNDMHADAAAFVSSPMVGIGVNNGSSLDRALSPPAAPIGGGRICVAAGSGSLTSLNAIAVTGAGTTRSWGVAHTNFGVQIAGTGTGLQVDFQGSIDGTTYFSMTPAATAGGTISGVHMTANGVYFFTGVPVLFTQVNIIAISTGTVTAKYAAG